VQSDIESAQRLVCKQFAAEFEPSLGESKTGFASSTAGQLPVNGLRHPPQNGTSGWYIWCGATFQEAGDFFSPVHTRHLYEEFPEIGRLLGLPPGFRFLLAGEHLDVWYDNSLLDI
jgi:hypothetical protein